MMILPTGSRIRSAAELQAARGFTLIEFILVMTLLLVVFAVSIPTLSNFFRGRTLDAEARRFVSLTRYAQSRAVSESLPMILWIDPNERTYGLEREYTYDNVDPKAVTYELHSDLTIEAVQSRSETRVISPMGQTQAARRNLPSIRFQPDGFISRGGLELITIEETDRDQEPVYIAPSRNRLSYEIKTNIYEILLPR